MAAVVAVRERKLERNSMRRQTLILRIILCVKVTSVVGTIVPGVMWAQNYLDINAYIYFFGMSPGRYIYNVWIFVWIFWFGYSAFFLGTVIICVYLLSTEAWLVYSL